MSCARLVGQYMPGVKQFGGAASELRAAEAATLGGEDARARRRAPGVGKRLGARDVSEETRAVAASARAALARASAADPREALRLESPAERAARANRRRAEATGGRGASRRRFVRGVKRGGLDHP